MKLVGIIIEGLFGYKDSMVKYLIRTCCLFLLISLGNSGVSQENLSLVIYGDDPVIVYDTVYADSFRLKNTIDQIRTNLNAQGFISSYFQLESRSNNQYQFILHKGLKYSWGNLIVSDLSQSYLGNTDIGTEVSPNKINVICEKILKSCENNGFPFARLFFDSVVIEKGKINAKLELIRGDLVVIDSIIVKGEVKTSRDFIQKKIGIEKGDIYNESDIRLINQKINGIRFLQTIRSPELFFKKGKATLVLYLKDNKSSRFNGIIGLNPDDNTGKIQVVGDIKINLLNALKKGENIILNWEQPKENSQKYLLNFSLPYMFKTRFGLETKLDYFRQDTSFANLDGKVGVSYYLDEYQKISGHIQRLQSNSLINSSELDVVPTINSASTTYLGLTYQFSSLDNVFNPRKGFSLIGSFNSGRKNIDKDPTITSDEYQNIQEKATQIKTDLIASCFIPLFKKNTLLLKVESGNIFGDNIFVNELYQLGGIKSIRGFNQQSLFASNYIVGTSEFRYLFDRNSSLFAFFDYGYFENKSLSTFETDSPFGFGFGVNLATNSGIFSVSYALGSQKNNPILVKNGKIHFGFVSLF